MEEFSVISSLQVNLDWGLLMVALSTLAYLTGISHLTIVLIVTGLLPMRFYLFKIKENIKYILLGDEKTYIFQ